MPENVTGAEKEGLQVVAVVIGLAVLEIIKKLAIDDEVIEKRVSSHWLKVFRGAFGPLFESGELPKEEVDPTFPDYGPVATDAYLALYDPDKYGGLGHSARVKRSLDLRDAQVASRGAQEAIN